MRLSLSPCVLLVLTTIPQRRRTTNVLSLKVVYAPTSSISLDLRRLETSLLWWQRLEFVMKMGKLRVTTSRRLEERVKTVPSLMRLRVKEVLEVEREKRRWMVTSAIGVARLDTILLSVRRIKMCAIVVEKRDISLRSARQLLLLALIVVKKVTRVWNVRSRRRLPGKCLL